MIIQHNHRRSIRLRQYDYTKSGAYFITICTQNRECLFGEIADGEMRLNPLGDVIQTCWDDLLVHYPHIVLDIFVIMPNHVHGITVITDDHTVGAGSPRPKHNGGAETAPLRKPTLGQMIAYFKYQSTKRINELRQLPGIPVWQRNYYERVIRNDAELNEIRQYIVYNSTNVGAGRPRPKHKGDAETSPLHYFCISNKIRPLLRR